MLPTILVSYIILLCLIQIFLITRWWILFKHYQFMFISKCRRRYEKAASIVVQCLLLNIIGVLAYIIWQMIIYVDSISTFTIRVI